MTKDQNAKRQREFQNKRKSENAVAFKWIVKKMRSEKGLRSIKVGLRRVLKMPEASPQQVIRASELLLHIESGEKKVNGKPLTRTVRVNPPIVDPGAPPKGPDVSPSNTDPSIVELLTKMGKD